MWIWCLQIWILLTIKKLYGTEIQNHFMLDIIVF